MAKKYLLTSAEKSAIMKSALLSVCYLLENDWGDPFKDRELPDSVVDRGDAVYNAADDHFFVCIKQIAKEMERRAK